MYAPQRAMRVRPALVVLHRWVGLLMAGFLFLTGLTGAIISWDHELDEWLNPHLMAVSSRGPAMPALALAREVEARDPRVQVTSLPLAAEQGGSLALWVEPRVDAATGQLFEPGYNQVFLDPVTGQELGRREWGAVWPVTSENVVSFLYKLHYSLHLPEMGGSDRWGIWLLGVIAVLWTLDCFTGVVLTLPARRRRNAARTVQEGRTWGARWWRAWQVRLGGGTYRLNFDLHRAVSLWTWALLLLLAFTAFSLNLYREVFFPLMSAVSEVTPSPFNQRSPTPPQAPIAPRLGYADIVPRAELEARRRGWAEPPGRVFYARHFGFYGVDFFELEDGHGAGGVGHKRLYYDGADGRLLGERLPWQGTAADLFVQAQFPLHSGRILGLPGRILISVMGLVVATLSVTGVYVWWKKRGGRRKAVARRTG